MSLSQMKLLNISGNKEYIDDVATTLGKSGVFHVDEAINFFSDKEKLIPFPIDNSVSMYIDDIRKILINSSITPEYVNPEDYSKYSIDELNERIKNFIDESYLYTDKIKDLKAKKEKCKYNINTTEKYTGIDVSFDEIKDCQYIKFHFGKLSKESYQKLEHFKNEPYIEFIPTSNDDHYFYGAYIAPVDMETDISRVFSSLYFKEADIEDMTGMADDFIKSEKAKLEKINKELDKVNDYTKNWGKNNKDELLKLFSRACELDAFSKIKSKSCYQKDTFIIIGWVPKEYAGQIKKELSSIKDINVQLSDAKNEVKHSPPVKLKNKFFAKPFEFYTEMYGLPSYNEIDPSLFIAITYTILFGIMFADLGQGIVLLIVALFMYFKMKMPLGRLLIPCSISSMIFGTIFGSFLGFEHALDFIYKDFFNLKEKPFEVLKSENITTIIFTAIGIGVFLLILAMIINIIVSFKKHDIGRALFDSTGIAGLVFYSSLVYALMGQFLLNIQVFSLTYVLLLIVLPLLLIFFREPLTKLINHEKDLFPDGVGGYIAENFFELFEIVLSFFTNTMSFLRVGAFVLVHAGMMLVVFAISDMLNPVGSVIVIIIGNIIVIALEALLVGIQVLRLEYYEMFSKFYEGDGKKYEPINIKNFSSKLGG